MGSILLACLFQHRLYMVYPNNASSKSDRERNNKLLLFENDRAKTTIWSQRFIMSAILQGLLIIVLTSSGIAIQLMYSSTSTNIIQFLSLSFEGPAKWIFLGYMFYLILITLIAATAIFYNHLEVNLQKRIRGIKSVLAWINLVGINVGGAAAAITIIYAGLAGSGVLDMMLNGGTTTTNLKQNTAIMAEFVSPIAAFAGLLIIGAVVGAILYFATYFQNTLHLSKRNTTNRSIQGGKMY
jgi:hypothetical protein